MRPGSAWALALLGACFSGCTTTPSGSGANLYGAYEFTLDDLYPGTGTFSIQEADGRCEGWVLLPGSAPAAELIRCTVSRHDVRLIVRPQTSAGRDLVLVGRLDGRELVGSWSAGGRRGRFVARRRGFG